MRRRKRDTDQWEVADDCVRRRRRRSKRRRRNRRTMRRRKRWSGGKGGGGVKGAVAHGLLPWQWDPCRAAQHKSPPFFPLSLLTHEFIFPFLSRCCCQTFSTTDLPPTLIGAAKSTLRAAIWLEMPQSHRERREQKNLFPELSVFLDCRATQQIDLSTRKVRKSKQFYGTEGKKKSSATQFDRVRGSNQIGCD